MNAGDLLGSGTISGKDANQRGSLLEQNDNGKTPIKLNDGEERMFLQDGDEIIMRGCCGTDGERVGFGDCAGVIVAAKSFPA